MTAGCGGRKGHENLLVVLRCTDGIVRPQRNLFFMRCGGGFMGCWSRRGEGV